MTPYGCVEEKNGAVWLFVWNEINQEHAFDLEILMEKMETSLLQFWLNGIFKRLTSFNWCSISG